MLKRHNKLVMLLVLATFMFSIVGSAGAASFSDVTGSDAEAAAIYKLNSLGIIDGYPDGTFGPEKTITRAEFAKIAVYTAGLEAVASGMQGIPSQFSDVSANEWYTGWVNVAAAQGFVKGDPAGTFRPNDQITQAEVATVLLRILGYNDNLPGVWPSNYIAKAANLGILDNVTFVANKAATRGEVAVMGSETLDQEIVEYIASDNYFEKQSETLLAKNFDDANKVEEVLVTEVKLSNNEYKMVTQAWDADSSKFNEAVVTINDDVVVSGALNIWGLDGKYVDFIVNEDDEATFISVNNDIPAPVFGEIDSVTTEKIEIDDKEYDFAEKWFLSVSKFNGQINIPGLGLVDLTIDAIKSNLINSFKTDGQKVTLNFNEDGEVVYVSVVSQDKALVVDEVKDDYIKTKSGERITGLDEDDVLIMKNGQVVEASDLQENDLIYWIKDAGDNVPRGFDVLLAAVSIPVTGEVTKVKGSNIYIDGNKYPLASKNALDNDYGFWAEDSDEDEVTDIADFLGEEVTAYLDGNGEVAFITGKTSDSDSGIVGTILDAGIETAYGSSTRWIKLFTEDGQEVTYDLDSDYYDDNYKTGVTAEEAAADRFGAWVGDAFDDNKDGTIEKFDLIEVKLNGDGEVKDIDALTDVATVTDEPIESEEEDWDRIDANGWKYVADDTVVIDLGLDASDDTDAALGSWADIEDVATLTADIYYTDDVIDYIVVKNVGGIVASALNGVFNEAYKVKAGDMTDIYVDGVLETYEYDGASLEKGAIYSFDVNSSNEASNVVAVASVVYGTVTYDGIYDSTESFNIGTDADTPVKTFKTTENTIVVKVNDDELSVVDFYSIDESDVVLVLEDSDDAGIAEIVVILDSESDNYTDVLNLYSIVTP